MKYLGSFDRAQYYLAGDKLECRCFYPGPRSTDGYYDHPYFDVWRCIGVPPDTMEEITRLIHVCSRDQARFCTEAEAAPSLDELNSLLGDGSYTFVYAEIDAAEIDSPTRTVHLNFPQWPCPFPAGWESVYRDHEKQVIIQLRPFADVDLVVWGEVLQ